MRSDDSLKLWEKWLTCRYPMPKTDGRIKTVTAEDRLLELERLFAGERDRLAMDQTEQATLLS